MDAVARFIVDHSKQVLAITAVLTLLAALMLFRLDFNADVASFILEGNERGEEFASLQAKYDTADPINVLATAPAGTTFAEPAGLASLAELRDVYGAQEGVAAVAALAPEQNPITGERLDPATIAALPAPMLAQLVDQSPVASLLLSDDATATLLVVVPDDDGIDLARRLHDVAPPDGMTVTLAGNPVIFGSVIDLLGWFLLVLPPAVMALLLGTFYAAIGDRRLTIFAVIPALLGSLWTFGLIFALGFEVDIVTVIVPIFVIVMGSADGLHFVTHFQEEATRTDDPYERVGSALRQVGIPMILTTVSTAAGFLSLLATDVRPIRQLGVFVAVGITFAGVISFFSLPALMSRVHVDASHHTSIIGPRIVSAIQRLVRTKTPALVLSLGLIAFAAVFIPQLEVDSDQLFFFKDDHEVRLAFNAIEDAFGGATPLVGEFVWDSSAGISGLDAVAATSAELENLDGVREVFSVADLRSLPEPQLQAFLDEEATVPLGDMVSEDGLRFALFPGEFDTDDLRTWVDFADTNDDVRVLTGMPVLWDETARLVLQAQVGSLIAAFVLVAIMLAASYRRLDQTVISLIPIALTIAVLLGFIAAAGINLNLITAIVSSIVIGVGIDYAIHYVAAIDHARAEGPGYVLRAIEHAGRPIVANALGIAIALTALWISPLKPHGQISLIMWVSMLTAALSALLIIPALMPREAVRA